MEPGKQAQLPDLLGIWKQFMIKQQDSLEEVLHQAMKTEEFSRMLDLHVEMALTRKQVTSQMFEQLLKDIPIPTQGDLTRVAGQVVSLDAKIDRLEVYLEETLEPMVRGLQEQLTRIEALLADGRGKAEAGAGKVAPARKGKGAGAAARAKTRAAQS